MVIGLVHFYVKARRYARACQGSTDRCSIMFIFSSARVEHDCAIPYVRVRRGFSSLV